MFGNKLIVIVTLAMALTSIANGQRSPYAGARPAGGYKDRYQPTQAGAEIGNRLGDVTTERLPYDAHGDAFIVHHSNQLPINNRPFWLLNQAHIEAQRGTPTNGASGTLSAQPALTAANATLLANNTSANRVNNNNVADRFSPNINNNLNALQDNTNYDPNIITQPQIVYPENMTAEQRQQLQAFYEQQRLQAIAQRQQQQQQQPQQNTQNRGQNPTQNQQPQFPQSSNQQQFPQNTNQQQFPQNSNQQQFPQNSNQQLFPQTSNQQPFPQNSNQQPIPQASNGQVQFTQRSNFVAPNFVQSSPQVPFPPVTGGPSFRPQYFPPINFQHPQRFRPDGPVVAPYFIDYEP